jgi:hypothetical protein
MTALINADTSSGVVITSDTSGSLALQSAGTTKMTVSSSGVSLNSSPITSFGGGVIVAGTAITTTSGTVASFTSIPSWVKRITVMFNGVSTSGSSLVQVQIGSGSYTTTGYSSFSCYAGSTNSVTSNTATTGFLIDAQSGGAGWVRYGNFVLTNITGNTWVASSTLGLNNGGGFYYSLTSGGSLALSGVLDRIQVTTVNGTDTFDAGSVNILYEG